MLTAEEAIFKVTAGKRITTKTVRFSRRLFREFEGVNDCFEQCPRHEATEAMQNMLKPTQFICVEKIDRNRLSFISKTLFVRSIPKIQGVHE